MFILNLLKNFFIIPNSYFPIYPQIKTYIKNTQLLNFIANSQFFYNHMHKKTVHVENSYFADYSKDLHKDFLNFNRNFDVLCQLDKISSEEFLTLKYKKSKIELPRFSTFYFFYDNMFRKLKKPEIDINAMSIDFEPMRTPISKFETDETPSIFFYN